MSFVHIAFLMTSYVVIANNGVFFRDKVLQCFYFLWIQEKKAEILYYLIKLDLILVIFCKITLNVCNCLVDDGTLIL